MSTHALMSLAAFERWKGRTSRSWQLADFREHCIDLGIARARRPLLHWLRDFKELTRDDAEFFDADGDGYFQLTDAGRALLVASGAAARKSPRRRRPSVRAPR